MTKPIMPVLTMSQTSLSGQAPKNNTPVPCDARKKSSRVLKRPNFKPDQRLNNTPQAPRSTRKGHSAVWKPRNFKANRNKHRKSREPASTAFTRPQTDREDKTLTHWRCRACPCQRGTFSPPVDACLSCGHNMDDHHDMEHDWNPATDYVSGRPALIASIMDLAEKMRVVVIRAPPQVGKSTLLMLLGRHILDERPDLEPVLVDWKHKYQRNELPYKEYLHRKKLEWQTTNGRYRPHNPSARTIYLIDEAQGSYEEDGFWNGDLKEHNTRSKPLFVLVCLYGETGISPVREARVASQALQMNNFQRVELRPSLRGQPHLLFTLEESSVMLLKWAVVNGFTAEDGLLEYLQMITGGHPGALGIVLHYISILHKLHEAYRHIQVWSPRLCQEVLTTHDQFLKCISVWSRGMWTASAELYIKQCLDHPSYCHIPFTDVIEALREVAVRPHGYTRPGNADAFLFLHKMGYIQSEQCSNDNKLITYTFSSPIHQRMAYRRLYPGPEPSGIFNPTNPMSIQQACFNAIERFSPAVLQYQSLRSENASRTPEVAFQMEMYCCFNYELRSLPILSEFAGAAKGRIDFYIADRRWGIEVLQNGTKADMAEHAARFAPGGRYREWNIFDDYIILNFCSESSGQRLEIEDEDAQSRFFNLMIGPQKKSIEVYTHDMRHQKTLTLAEGRQRFNAEEFQMVEEHRERQRWQKDIEQLKATGAAQKQEIEQLRLQLGLRAERVGKK